MVRKQFPEFYKVWMHKTESPSKNQFFEQKKEVLA